MAKYGSNEWWKDRVDDAKANGKGGTISVRCKECLGVVHDENNPWECGCAEALAEWEYRLYDLVGKAHLAGMASGIPINDAVSRVRS